MNKLNLIKSIFDIIFGGIELILGIRFLLKILGAAPANGFTNWIYTNSEIFILSITKSIKTITLKDNFILEPAIILAMIFFAIINLAIAYILRLIAQKQNKG